MSGNLARRRQTKFMPADFKLIEARQPPLKDQYDEWLARRTCLEAAASPAIPGLEQKENISLTAYARFPVAPIFMIWSFAWGSAWTRWPCASIALSTHIFLCNVHDSFGSKRSAST